jgi:hypothetical protein
MFSEKKLKLDDGLYRKAKARASKLGYASVAEFVTHLLERELDKQADGEDGDAVRQRLKGLGYLD